VYDRGAEKKSPHRVRSLLYTLAHSLSRAHLMCLGT